MKIELSATSPHLPAKDKRDNYYMDKEGRRVSLGSIRRSVREITIQSTKDQQGERIRRPFFVSVLSRSFHITWNHEPGSNYKLDVKIRAKNRGINDR